MIVLTEKGSFKEFISSELHVADASLPKEIKSYLTDLLSFYLFTDRLFEYKEDKKSYCEQTFNELYVKLQEAQLNERVHLLKKMGDLSLYTSGFFRASIKRKIVDISYYEIIGERAYGNLAHFYNEKSVFESLSKEFKNLSEILFYIQKKLGLQGDQNYIKLYEEYLETQENSVLKRLIKEEVCLEEKTDQEKR